MVKFALFYHFTLIYFYSGSLALFVRSTGCLSFDLQQWILEVSYYDRSRLMVNGNKKYFLHKKRMR